MSSIRHVQHLQKNEPSRLINGLYHKIANILLSYVQCWLLKESLPKCSIVHMGTHNCKPSLLSETFQPLNNKTLLFNSQRARRLGSYYLLPLRLSSFSAITPPRHKIHHRHDSIFWKAPHRHVPIGFSLPSERHAHQFGNSGKRESSWASLLKSGMLIK